MDDGKYIMTLDGEDHEVIVSTLLEGQYPCKNTSQFVCIPLHFPIPLDSWMLKDAVFRPSAQQSVNQTARISRQKKSKNKMLAVVAKGIY